MGTVIRGVAKSLVGNPLFFLMYVFYMTIGYKQDRITEISPVGLVIALLVALLNIYAIYLAVNYPTSSCEWVLSPFRMVTRLFKKIIKGVSWVLHNLRDSVTMLFLIGTLTGIVIGALYVILEAVEAMKTCGYSLQCLYDTCHPAIAILAILIGLLAIALVLFVGLDLLRDFWCLIRDPVLLRYLSLNSSVRPTMATQAVERLNAFEMDFVKVQYLHNLRNWLPISSEWKVFVEEANNHKGAVRDELYKLAELWQDSRQSNGGGAVA
jgi:hypothetical protein